ncbi:hypothetical protein GCM10011318_08360 [Phaeocystidibacter marisrubri]|uniref:Tetratricopeptide repeat protein n=2 Tax=Phaeocystidibacter marisrubri TaxID=1577780 RepID=A0A6L3ZF31_9FLAO|nr:hypothetical protein F8C82_11540 [Phaeocystidibacter marisrubri]GGH68389.1 hypothetical protein GCM10011318_08360 [Phaeocystidibacter marisrubri]
MMKNLLALSLAFVFSFVSKAQDTTELEHKIHEFGREMEDSLYALNSDFMKDHMDLSRFVDTVMHQFEEKLVEDIELPLSMMKGMLVTSLSNDFTIANEIVGTIDAGGDYRYIHYFQKGGTYYLVYRLSNIESAFAYHLLPLDVSDEEDIQIYNIYTSMTGENISETMADAMAANMIQRQGSAQMRAEVAKLKEAQTLAVFDPKAAVQMLNEIEGPIRSTSFYSTIAKEIQRIAHPEEIHEEQLAIIESGGPISLHQAQIGLAYWAELGDTLNTKILGDTIRTWVGKDPYLLLYEGVASEAAGDFNKAIPLFQECIEKTNVDPFPIRYMLSVVYIEKGEPKNACTEFGKILLDYCLWPEDLVEIYEDYPDFVKSDAYATWEEKFLRTHYPDYFEK